MKPCGLLVLAIVATPIPALACSGPGMMAVIEAAERRGWIMFAIAAVLALGAIAIPEFRRRPGAWWPLLVVLAIHPGWWLSARAGDCGRMLRTGSLAATALMPVLIGLAYLWARRRRRNADDPTRV